MNTVKSFFGYFFTKTPGAEFSYYVPTITFVIVLIGGGIAFSAFYKHKKKRDPAFKVLFKKTATKLVIFGLLFGLLTLMRYEQVPYFSMRIWLYLLSLLFLWFLYRTIRVIKIDYPREKQNVKQKQSIPGKKEKKVYLPNKKSPAKRKQM